MNFCYCFCICVGVKLHLFGWVVYCCCNIHYFFVIIIMYHYHGKAALHDDLSMICRWSVAVIWLVGMLLYISIYNMPYVTVVTFFIFFWYYHHGSLSRHLRLFPFSLVGWATHCLDLPICLAVTGLSLCWSTYILPVQVAWVLVFVSLLCASNKGIFRVESHRCNSIGW